MFLPSEMIAGSQSTQENATLLPSSSLPNRRYYAAKDYLYFTASNAGRHEWDPEVKLTYTTDLWISDGTVSGTRLLAQGLPGTIDQAYASGNKLYISYFTHEHGGELWVADPVSDNISLVKDINLGIEGSTGYFFGASFGDKFYFTAHDGDGVQGPWEGVWVTDGTADGTTLFSSEAYGAHDYRTIGDWLLFNTGSRAWISDGTAEGTHAYSVQLQSWDDSNSAVLNGKSYVLGYRNLFEINPDDGSLAIVDSHENTRSSLDVVYKGELFYSDNHPVYGSEPWAFSIEDGTARLLKDLQPQYQDAAPWLNGSGPEQFTVSGDYLYFAARAYGPEGYDSESFNLWRTDGTSDGTLVVHQSEASHSRLMDVEGELYFGSLREDDIWELWKTNGTPSGTAFVSVMADYDFAW